MFDHYFLSLSSFYSRSRKSFFTFLVVVFLFECRNEEYALYNSDRIVFPVTVRIPQLSFDQAKLGLAKASQYCCKVVAPVTLALL